MSEKHLSEVAWKSLAVQNKVKDPGLGKALGELSKCEVANFIAGFKALDLVENHVQTLKRDCKKNAELTEYLTDVLKEAFKRRKLFEAAKATPPAKDESAEAETDESADLKSKLAGGMRRVKLRKPSDPAVEVMVCKAGTAFALLLAKTVGAAQKKELEEILKDEKGHKFVKGRCDFGDGEIYTFILESLPAGAAKGLKAFLKTHTQNTYKLKVCDESGAVEEDLADADGKVASAPPKAPAPPQPQPKAPAPPGPPLSPVARKFAERLKALQPEILKAIQAGGAEGQAIKLRSSEVGTLARNGDFESANAVLDKLEPLLKKSPTPAADLKPAAATDDNKAKKHDHAHDHKHKDREAAALLKQRQEGCELLNGAANDLKELLGKDKSTETKNLLEAFKGLKLDAKSRDESVTSKLTEIQAACAAWLRQAKVDPNVAPVIQNLLNEVRKEVMERDLDAKQSRRAAITGAVADVQLTAAIAAKGQAALQNYDAAVKSGKKNGAAAAAALDNIEKECALWLDDPKNKANPAREKVKATMAQVQKELGAIRQTQESLKLLKQPSKDFKSTGVWSGDGVTGLEISSARTLKDVKFVPGTDEKQIKEFLATLELEAERSDVFAALIKDFISGDSPTPLKLSFGKSSCGFGDSSATMAVDMDDFKSMPGQPSEVSMPDGTTAMGGATGTEVLLHVLEERFYMQQNGGNYSKAHDRCLSAGSMQNRYRSELGMASNSVVFDCHEHDHAPGLKPSEQMADFIAIDDRGIIQTTKDIKFHKDSDPVGTKYEPNAAQTSAPVLGNLAAEMDSRLDKLWETFFLKPLTASHGEYAFDSNKTNLEMMRQYLDRKFAGDEAQVSKGVDAYKKEFSKKAMELKKKFREDQKVWRAKLTTVTKTAQDFLAEDPDPADAGSKDLQARRKQRAAIQINDSCNNKNTDGSMSGMSYQDQNCALTSLGAILGKNSSQVVEAYLVKQGVSAEAAKKCSSIQDTTIFWRAQQKKLSTSQHMFGEGDMPASESAPEVGDAQLTGIRELINAEAQERSKKGSPKYKTIQDGSPEKGQMYPMAELLGRMKKYPSGTQFQIFLNAGTSTPGVHGSRHWIYGEIYKGKLVIEDYQKTVDAVKKAAKQTAYVVDGTPEGPNHPTTDEPAVFAEGCFVALVPDVPALKGIDAPDTKNAKFPQLK